MTPPHDIALNQELDVELSGEDLIIRDSTEQHQRLLLLAQPGNLRWAPTVGVGLQDYLADEQMAGLVNKVRQQFQLATAQYESLQGYLNIATTRSYDRTDPDINITDNQQGIFGVFIGLRSEGSPVWTLPLSRAEARNLNAGNRRKLWVRYRGSGTRNSLEKDFLVTVKTSVKHLTNQV